MREHYTMQRIGICGLGLIGQQRLKALQDLGWDPSQIIVFDPKIKSDDSVKFQVANSIDFILKSNVDLAIVATPHNIAPDLTSKFLDQGSRVLMEKPMGRWCSIIKWNK